MTTLTAKFKQTPNESRRYLIDYTLDLANGETVTGVGTPTVVPANGVPVSPALVVSSVVIAPGGLQVAFFVHGGSDGGTYEVQFLVTTSIGQVREDVIEFDIAGDL